MTTKLTKTQKKRIFLTLLQDNKLLREKVKNVSARSILRGFKSI